MTPHEVTEEEKRVLGLWRALSLTEQEAAMLVLIAMTKGAPVAREPQLPPNNPSAPRQREVSDAPRKR